LGGGDRDLWVSAFGSATHVVVDVQGYYPDPTIVGTTRPVSVGVGGAPANDVSDPTSISADGRFVVFTSFASNLVAGDTNGVSDVFVFDRQLGVTSRVSVGAGGGQADGESRDGLISADGRFVVFTSFASNLVAGDTNGVSDVFVFDRQLGVTSRVSVGAGGGQANGESGDGVISADGRFVVFVSSASNLVEGVWGFWRSVFVHDRHSGVTSLVATQATRPAISADGRIVAFLGPWGTGLFVTDRQTDSTQQVVTTSAPHLAMDVSMSSTGRFLAYTDDSVSYVLDRQTGTTDRILGPRRSESLRPRISADGRSVVFASPGVLATWAGERIPTEVILWERS
jgi:Tol biopolymer transport system component